MMRISIRHYFLKTTLCIVLTMPVMLSAQEDRHETRVKDLAYGTALFHLFQHKKLAAITELTVADEKNMLNNQRADADLLLASLYFEYGLPQQTALIFNQLLEHNLAPETQHNVWFNLARVEYEQENFELAEDYLSRLLQPLPAQQESQRYYIQSSLQLNNGQLDDAITSASAIKAGDSWYAYAQYNLGIAQIAARETEKGLQRLKSLSALKTTDKETLALQDSANLVSGLILMNQNRLDDALAQLRKISIQSPVTNKALLATGTIWSRKNEAKKALAYWQLLIKRHQPDRATLEASLLTAGAYEQLGNRTLAAQAYDLAVKLYQQQSTQLDDMINSIPRLQLYTALPEDRLLSASAIATLKSDPLLFKTLSTLQQTISASPFQQALQQYRELQEIADSIARWKDSIPAFKLMLHERRQSFAGKQPLVLQALDLQQLESFQQQRSALAEEVNRIEQQQDFLALANASESDHLAQLDEVKALLARLPQDRDLSTERQQYRLLYGLLYWDISTDFAPRFWKLKQQLLQLDSALQQAAASTASVQQASARYEQRLYALNQRIQQQETEIERLQSTLNELIPRQQQYINQLAISALQQRKKHIAQLQLSARYSLARLYDELSTQSRKKP
ncbi:MAG: hypothetical protein ISR73_11865 [Gammaproteobacteria bacterium]|nr:hypothetical protein [Gammaproteobacteria bacterium]